jgi:hypothetical protein
VAGVTAACGAAGAREDGERVRAHAAAFLPPLSRAVEHMRDMWKKDGGSSTNIMASTVKARGRPSLTLAKAIAYL